MRNTLAVQAEHYVSSGAYLCKIHTIGVKCPYLGGQSLFFMIPKLPATCYIIISVVVYMHRLRLNEALHSLTTPSCEITCQYYFVMAHTL